MKWLGFLCVIFSMLLIHTSSARAHALDPGYLEITPLSNETWHVFWSRPDVKGRAMDIGAQLPPDCSPRTSPEAAFNGSAWTAGWITTCSDGMTGGPLLIKNLEQTRTDVLVRYALTLGKSQTLRLTPDKTGVVLTAGDKWRDVLISYVPLGVEHILSGVDHLLFVFVLLLLIPDGWRLVGALTAFTVAHSLTLAAATLNLVSLPSAPVEAVIALSIMFLASELLHREEGALRLSERYPWAISFSFGLLHGFGFASALTDIGLPHGDVPLALLSFNLGVEFGQLGFVAVVFMLGWVLRHQLPVVANSLTERDKPAATAMAYGIGRMSAYWFLDRLSGFT